jgi:hypothetical protein
MSFLTCKKKNEKLENFRSIGISIYLNAFATYDENSLIIPEVKQKRSNTWKQH